MVGQGLALSVRSTAHEEKDMADKLGPTKEEQEEAIFLLLKDGILGELLEDSTDSPEKSKDISQERPYALPADPPSGSESVEHQGTYSPPPPYLVGLLSKMPKGDSGSMPRTVKRGKLTSVPTRRSR